VEAQIDAYKNDNYDSLVVPTRAYVTFEHSSTKDSILEQKPRLSLDGLELNYV